MVKDQIKQKYIEKDEGAAQLEEREEKRHILTDIKTL